MLTLRIAVCGRGFFDLVVSVQFAQLALAASPFSTVLSVGWVFVPESV